jgi:hypothetical protein
MSDKLTKAKAASYDDTFDRDGEPVFDSACSRRDYYQRKEIERLRELLGRVHNELHDPMGERWCDQPGADRGLLETLHNHVDKEMGWEVDDE